MTTFAETVITYPDTQSNVEAPPESLLMNGFIPKGIGRRGQPLPANWLNWIFRELFRSVNRDRISNGAGIGVLSAMDTDAIITLYAVQKSDPTKYIHAVGYKSGGGVPVFKVIGSATLTLGTVTATNIPIAGATSSDIIQQLHVQKA